MSVRVAVTVEIGGVTFHVERCPPGDAPVYMASGVRRALLECAGEVDEAVTALRGDVDPGNASYVPPLPTYTEWRL